MEDSGASVNPFEDPAGAFPWLPLNRLASRQEEREMELRQIASSARGRVWGLDGNQWADLWSGLLGSVMASIVGGIAAALTAWFVLLKTNQTTRAAVAVQLEAAADEARMRGFESAVADTVVALEHLPHAKAEDAGSILASLKGALTKIQLSSPNVLVKGEVSAWRMYFHDLESYRWTQTGFSPAAMTPLYSSVRREQASRWLKEARDALETALLQAHSGWRATPSKVVFDLREVRTELERALRKEDGPIETNRG